MTFISLAVIALGLTIALFVYRDALLGFPSAIFWMILGAYLYTESSTPWGDWQFYLFFASAFGMAILCMLGAWGLREKRDTMAEEEFEKGE